MTSEKKMQIVIDNYFKSECNVDTSIRDAFEKGFRIGVQKSLPSADAVQGEWEQTITWQPYCSNCEYVFGEDEEFSPFWKYCPMCGARMKGGDDE